MNRKNALWKRLLGLATALVAVLSMGACKEATAEEIMQAAQDKLSKITSMRYEMRMDMDMEVTGAAVQTSTLGTIDYILDPTIMKMSMDTDMGDLGSMNIQMYMLEKDGEYLAYAGMDDGNGGKVWTQSKADVTDIEQYDGQADMELYLSSADSFQQMGTETVNGKDAVRYDGVISGDALGRVVATSAGMVGQMESAYGTGDPGSLIDPESTLPISIWIDGKSGLPVQYEMDMTEIMQSMFRQMSADSAEELADLAEMRFSKVHVMMTVIGYDCVDAIEIPPEAQGSEQA